MRRYHRGMDIYLVGGAVRDELLGLPVQERDWVVVGATAEAMLAQGYKPVGRDFPVFLHPETSEEYALARTERKTGPGYRGFVVHAEPTVTLEEDLRRRDLTINAMAKDAAGRIVDPYGGQDDLRAGLLRHVSPAFTEDPVRILRVARFAARYARFGFRVAHATHVLMRRMVEDGEADHLVPERVFAELDKALAEPAPARFFEVLAACGALEHVLPELAGVIVAPHGHGQPAERAALDRLERAAAQTNAPPVRFAALVRALDEGRIAALGDRLKLPNAYRDLARLAVRNCEAITQADRLAPEALLALLEALDALRRPERLADLGVACTAGGDATARLEQARAACAAVSADVLLAQGFAGAALGAALREHRLAALAGLVRS